MNSVRGFTLIELMVVVALVAIGTLIAAPSLQSMIRNNRAAAQTNALISALTIARSEAVRRGSNVSICPGDSSGCDNSSNWKQGWLVFSDSDTPGTYTAKDEILKIFPPLSGSSALAEKNSVKLISFAGDGFLDPNVNNAELQFSLKAKGCEGTEAREITLSLQGRPSVARASC